VEIRDAGELWGRSSWDTEDLIRERTGMPDAKIASIGPAGENLVRFACVMNDKHRAAGRNGVGAVMGSKNLKAIAARGSKGVKVSRPEEFVRVCQQSARFQAEIGRTERRYKALRGSGAPMWLDYMMQAGSGAVRNYSTTEMPSWTGISGERFQVGGDYNVRKRACFSCSVACGGFFNVRSGEFARTFGRTPEAGITTIGLSCNVDSIPPLLKLEVLLDELGIDGISAGNLISWAMDCYSRGLLSQEDCDGLALDWGNYGTIIGLLHRVARREGFGDLLAEGEKRAPQRLGRGSEKFMYHIKGLSPVCEDPRASRIFGASYFTASRGGDNLTANVLWVPDLLRDSDLVKETFGKFGRKKAPGDRSVEGVGEALKLGEDVTAVINSAEVCTRSGGTFEFITRALSAATGVDFSVASLLRTGERIFNLEKAFNAREGLNRKHDNYSVPEKFTTEPIAAGPFQGDVFFNLEELLDKYYTARGWDVATGLPTRARLTELGLGHIIPELEKAKAVR
ncbi:MAG: hypothetical protein HY670_04190, partial [Chloroflexi bacterium]|nr:hypothetical protein [Chloroflexota bacterium]